MARVIIVDSRLESLKRWGTIGALKEPEKVGIPNVTAMAITVGAKLGEKGLRRLK